ncbi:MAG: hypothetical protein NUV92_02305 [Ignavibacteria bacterium]|jgi:hypothetical protein|nr:hypothetical protein [Ignavibacteria bacterium]MDH7527066.1 hypothetical protein [Ignavibacteria bacterium]NPV10789.1 hypothetical protein [Ignavibacteria bacterium]
MQVKIRNRNKSSQSLIKTCGIFFLFILFLTISGCSKSERLSKKDWFYLMEDLRLRKNNLELEKSYLKEVLKDSLLVDSLRIELKNCNDEIEKFKEFDSSQVGKGFFID